MLSNKHLRLLPVSSDASKDATPSSPAPPAAFLFDPNLGPGHCVPMRSDFLCSPHFTAAAKVLYGVLLCHASMGVQDWPGSEKLAEECAISTELVEEAMSALLATRLVTHRDASRDHQESYYLHSLGNLLMAQRPGKETPLHFSRNIRQHIPQEQPTTKQIQKDAQLLMKKVGISPRAARNLAQLATERGCSEGYVAEVVEYALTTPGIKNPAGCVVELIRRNESRRPNTQLSQQGTSQALDAEKYTTGKYAFLFRRHGRIAGMEGDRNGSDRESEGPKDQEAQGDGAEEDEL